MRRFLPLLTVAALATPAATAVAQDAAPVPPAPSVTAPLPAAPASTPGLLQIGLSEQRATVFADAGFRKLGLRYARLVVPWNVALKRGSAQTAARTWIFAALADGVEPHIAFNAVRFDRRAANQVPTMAEYRRAFRAFRQMFPGVRVFTPWNEANHVFQPTAKRPELAARYYAALRAACKTCTIVGADVLDQKGLEAWFKRFQRALRGPKPRVWGLHNYGDANHRIPLSRSWTLRFAKLVRGQIWSTESGGIVRYVTDRGRVAFPYSPARAATSLSYLFKLMRATPVRSRYTRVYLYNWYGAPQKTKHMRWDSGLVSADGTARPALRIVRRQVTFEAARAAARR